MSIRRRKASREKDLTGRYFSGDFEEDRVESSQRFTDRGKHAEQNKIQRTQTQRAADGVGAASMDALPVGRVVQVYSLYYVVGDLVKFRDSGSVDESSGRPEAVIEQVLPRKTVLTRSDSFSGIEQHPIVANADQMLIVVSLVKPEVKWGLVDRMLVAAQAGGLLPVVCLNKIDLARSDQTAGQELDFAMAVLAHYATMGIRCLQTSAIAQIGLDELRQILRDKTTVLAGHSGVGKSTLIKSIQPALDVRIGEISNFTAKGRHTTTSAREYPLDFGGKVIDTPGVKLFGLWGVDAKNLSDFFPDVASNSAPEWRMESFRRIERSLPN